MPEALEDVVQRLKTMIGSVAQVWKQPLPNRIYIDVKREDVREGARMLYKDFGARFVTATGMDRGEELEVLYHFAYDAVGLVVNMRVGTPKSDGTLPSVTPLVPAAEWIEREIYDLVGIEFEGHPRPERLILADDWPDGVYPLRKDKEDGA